MIGVQQVFLLTIKPVQSRMEAVIAHSTPAQTECTNSRFQYLQI